MELKLRTWSGPCLWLWAWLLLVCLCGSCLSAQDESSPPPAISVSASNRAAQQPLVAPLPEEPHGGTNLTGERLTSTASTAGALSNGVLQIEAAAASQGKPLPGNPVLSRNDALKHSQEMIVTPSLLDPARPTNATQHVEELQRMLNAARQQRVEKNVNLATTTLVSILNAEAPEEIHRTALLELAVTVQQDGQLARAQQIFAQFQNRYPEDPSIPEVLLRQGLLYRQMGANTMALAKFYAVMTTALNLKADRFEYYQRLVLQAQTEIADTYYFLSQYSEAAEFFSRLLKLQTGELNRPLIQFKLVRSLANLGSYPEVVAQAQDFLNRFPTVPEQPEMRFLLANALKQLGRNREALQHVLILLEGQRHATNQNPANWIYWQQRTGNEIANQLYREGDYVNALEIYLNLAPLDNSLAWQLPVWYQIGLVYERLNQPQKAVDVFGRITARQKELGTNAPPSLQAVIDMANWRKGFLGWQAQAEEKARQFQPVTPDSSPETAVH